MKILHSGKSGSLWASSRSAWVAEPRGAQHGVAQPRCAWSFSLRLPQVAESRISSLCSVVQFAQCSNKRTSSCSKTLIDWQPFSEPGFFEIGQKLRTFAKKDYFATALTPSLSKSCHIRKVGRLRQYTTCHGVADRSIVCMLRRPTLAALRPLNLTSILIWHLIEAVFESGWYVARLLLTRTSTRWWRRTCLKLKEVFVQI